MINFDFDFIQNHKCNLLMKRLINLSVATVLIVAVSCKEAPKKVIKTPKEKRESELKYTERIQNEFAKIIEIADVEGSILLFDFQKEKYYSNDLEWAKKEFLPASTFKVPNTIIALETGAIESDTTTFIWDGKPRKMEEWNKTMTLNEAFQVSCVPCYQEVAREIGYDRMKQYLGRFNYGNMQFTAKTVDKFWLEGKSGISQYQQIDFLERFYHDGLGVSERTTNLAKKIMVIDTRNSYVLSGKTGWSAENGNDNGWFVGYVEVGTDVYFFATNVRPKPGFNMERFADIRVDITKAALQGAGIIK